MKPLELIQLIRAVTGGVSRLYLSLGARSAGVVLCLVTVQIRGNAQTSAEANDSAIRLFRLPSGLRYGIMGSSIGHPAPTVFAFQGSIESMQREPVYTEVSRILVRHGILGVVLDVPAHGEDHRQGEPPELSGWRERVDHGENLVGSFAANASKVLDRLVEEGQTDPSKVGAYGTSRGGFMAFHFAAFDRRVKAVAGISPVTDLSALREFRGTAHPDSVEKLSLLRLVPMLAGRPVWISIGNHDKRVETESAIAFTRELVNYSDQGKPDDAVIPVDLLVGPTPGHSKIDHASELLAAWLLRQLDLK